MLPRRTGAYSPGWLDQLCASGEVVWIGAGALGRRSGRVALYFREDVALLGPPPGRGEAPAEPAHEAIRERLRAGACFFTDLLVDVAGIADRGAPGGAVGPRVGGRGDQRRVRAAALAEAQRASGRSRRAPTAARSFSARRRGAQPQVQGRWSLTSRTCSAPSADPVQRRRTQAELLLERYGIVTREQVLAEGIPGGFSSLYDQLAALETVGVARRGYFIEGLGGAQFALPGAVERLRAQRDDDEAPPVVLAATDPAQPYGAVLKWPKTRGARSPARQAGAYVVLAGARAGPLRRARRQGPAGARRPAATSGSRPALEALVDAVRRGRVRRLALERVDGEPIVGSAYEEPLIELGFRAGPRKLTLTA